MSMKKKIATGALLVAFGATAVTGATLAYFTDTEKATNTFTVGNVDITLTEPNWVGTGSKDAPEVYPGEVLDKDPTVECTSANPCFVRVSVTNLDQFGGIKYKTDWTLDKLGDGWQYNPNDGYYYYTRILGKGDKTDALFDQIVMPTNLTGNEEAKDIVVTAEAVQAQGALNKNWAGVQAMGYEDIVKWFGIAYKAPAVTE